MKVLRILLLVVLAVMLPVRGVMAAAMLCPPAVGAAGEAQAMTPPSGDMHHHADDDGHPHAEAGMGATGHHHDGAGPDSCKLCSACCSVPPLPSAAPAVALRHDLGAAVFPAPCAPSPSFLSDGQDRPPRST